MGVYFTDKFSLLHFVTGVSVYYWNISLLEWFIIHGLFEILENSKYGILFLQKVKYWPGGKASADTVINSLGDQFYSILGWLFAHFICTTFFA